MHAERHRRALDATCDVPRLVARPILRQNRRAADGTFNEGGAMFMVREVLSCKPGKVGELAKKFKALGAVMQSMDLEPFRVYTDVSGEPFWTLVLQREYDSLDEIPAIEGKVMSDERAQSAMAGYHDLVVGGRREIYKVEA